MKKALLLLSAIFMSYCFFGQKIIDPDTDSPYYIYSYIPIGATNDGSSIIYYKDAGSVPANIDDNSVIISNGSTELPVSANNYSFGDDIGLFYVMLKSGSSSISVKVYDKETLLQKKSYTLSLPNDFDSNIEFVTFDDDSLFLFTANESTIYCYHGNLVDGQITLNSTDYDSFTASYAINKIKAISTFDENNNPVTLVLAGSNLKVYFLYDNKEGQFVLRQTFGGTLKAATENITAMSLIDGYFEGENYSNGYIHFAKVKDSTLYVCQYNLSNNTLQDWIVYRSNVRGSSGVNFVKTYEQIDNNTIEQKIKLCYVTYAIDENGTETDNIAVTTKNSDKLELRKVTTDLPPDDILSQVCDLIAVIEGPPPFPMNGYTLTELNSPSTLIFGNSESSSTTSGTSNSVTTSFSKQITTGGSISTGISLFKGLFKISAEASYHKSWESTNATVNTSSNTITTTQAVNVYNTITTPAANEEASMVYIYLAPSVEKTEWELVKPDGTSYNPQRTITFINFTNPQIKFETKPLSDFSNSPSIFDLYSYSNRNVSAFDGIGENQMIELQQDIAQGISQTMSINFSNSTSYSYGLSNSFGKKTISELGAGVSVKLFSFKVGADVSSTQVYSTTSTYNYSRTLTTTVGQTFNLSYNIPKPKDLSDPDNVRAFTTKFYLMNTTSDDAYYLTDEFKGYRPLFITYEVKNIETGSFLTPVEENMSLNIYPNPVRDNLYLDNLPANSTLQITDMQGKTVIQTAAHGQTLDVSNLKPGIYFIKVESEKGVYTSKLIKE